MRRKSLHPTDCEWIAFTRFGNRRIEFYATKRQIKLDPSKLLRVQLQWFALLVIGLKTGYLRCIYGKFALNITSFGRVQHIRGNKYARSRSGIKANRSILPLISGRKLADYIFFLPSHRQSFQSTQEKITSVTHGLSPRSWWRVACLSKLDLLRRRERLDWIIPFWTAGNCIDKNENYRLPEIRSFPVLGTWIVRPDGSKWRPLRYCLRAWLEFRGIRKQTRCKHSCAGAKVPGRYVKQRP